VRFVWLRSSRDDGAGLLVNGDVDVAVSGVFIRQGYWLSPPPAIA
jgi:hypothetical protein